MAWVRTAGGCNPLWGGGAAVSSLMHLGEIFMVERRKEPTCDLAHLFVHLCNGQQSRLKQEENIGYDLKSEGCD